MVHVSSSVQTTIRTAVTSNATLVTKAVLITTYAVISKLVLRPCPAAGQKFLGKKGRLPDTRPASQLIRCSSSH